MTYIVERTTHRDLIVIRHGRTFDILATRIKTLEGYKWTSDDPKIQAICDEWGPGSTSEGLASIIMKEINRP